MRILSTCFLALLCCVFSTSVAKDVVLSLPNTNALALSPDSETLAVATAEGTVLLSTKWHSVNTTLKNDNGITSIAWNNKGNLLAAGSANGTIQIWDVYKKQVLTSFSAKGTAISCIVWNGDNSFLAAGTAKGAILVWDTHANKTTRTLIGHTSAVASLAWHENTLVSAGKDNTIMRWSTAQSSPLYKYPFPYPTTVLAWNPDGIRLLIGTSKGAFIRNTITENDTPCSLSSGKSVLAAAWSTTGEYAAIVDGTGAVAFWPETLSEEIQPLDVNTDNVPVLAFSHPRNTITSNGREVILHDLTYTTETPLVAIVLQPSLSAVPQPVAHAGVAQIHLPQSSNTRLALIDQYGREILVLHDGRLPQGTTAFPLEVSHLSSGVYYLTAQTALYRLLAPCVIVR